MTLPEPIRLVDLMEEFTIWLKTTSEHPITLAAEAHLKFVTIHPFIDGNGRTARLLMNLLLMQQGYPPALIMPHERAAYISSLAQAQTTKNYENYYAVMCKGIERSLDIYIETAEKSL